MGARLNKSDLELLKPGLWIGKCPDTGIVFRLTINGKGRITIERKPYISSCADGWTQHYEELIDDAEKHLFLIQKIKANPSDWV